MTKQFPETKFPETIFVTQESDGEDGSVLFASEDAGEMAEPGVAVPAAEYRLVRAGVVVAYAEFEAA